MKKVSLLLLLSMMTGVFSPMAKAMEGPMYIYVDCKAADDGDGSYEKPFKTIDEARLKIRTAKKESGYPEKGIVVSIREGDYFAMDGITFTKEDAGTKEAPIVYRAYANESVRILGGNEISFDKFKPVKDEKVLENLQSGLAGKIYQLDMEEYGINMFDEFGINGHAASGLNAAGQNPTNGAALPAIYWNGKPTDIARYPNSGNYMFVDKVLNSGSTTDYTQQMSFTVADTRIENWEDKDDIWLWGLLRYDWSDIHMPIASLDTKTGTINTLRSCDYGVLSGQKFYVYNIFEELDAPGEWYLDKDKKILYMYPLDDDKNATIDMAFSSAPVLRFEDTDYITFRDVSIMCTRSSAVSINKSTGINIKYCEIAYASNVGVMINGDPGGRTFGDSSYDCNVEGCHIYYVGAQGIYIHYAGNRGDLTPANCRAFNNWIHDFGTIVKTYSGGVNTRGVGIDVSFNLIHDGTHLGINPGGNDITVRYNDVSKVLKEASDMGAIYFGGDPIARGTIIEQNRVHDVSTASTQHDIHAIYNDDAGAGATIRNNVIYNIAGNGVFINGGRDNTVENNVFANLKGVGVILKAAFISGSLYTNWESGKLGAGLRENVVDWKSEPYNKYPHLSNILEDDPPFPKYNVMQNNVTYNSKGGQTIDPLSSGYSVKEIASWGTVGDEIVTNGDIGFTDVENNNFKLKTDSSIYATLPDFTEIEDDRIGLVTSRLRKYLSKNAVAMVVNEPRTYINWTRGMVDENDLNVVPFIKDDLTYVPIRFLFEAFNADVQWKDQKAQIVYNGKNIVLEQNSDIAYVDGVEYKLSGEVINKDSRIFVPLRSCSELMNKSVLWKDVGLIIVSDKNLEDAFSYEEMVYDLVSRLSER